MNATAAPGLNIRVRTRSKRRRTHTPHNKTRHMCLDRAPRKGVGVAHSDIFSEYLRGRRTLDVPSLHAKITIACGAPTPQRILSGCRRVS